MKKFAKIMLIALGFGLVTLVLGFLTSNPRPAHAAPVAHVIVTNTPLPIQGSVNANVTGTVSVSNFPPTQTVSFNGATQPVSFSNTLTTPIFNRDVDNGSNPFQLRLALDNGFVNPAFPGSSCSNVEQCQVNFNVPAGMRLVIEHISARVLGASGQKYEAFVTAQSATAQNVGGTTIWLVLNFQGTFNNGTTDIYTTSQQMRVYTDDTAQPPAAAVVQSNGVQPFFAEIDISGYLVPKS